MSVGVERLDRDHRVLIGLINRLATCARGVDAGGADARGGDACCGGGGGATVVAEVLKGLIAYTRFHFRREERVMEACGYADLDAHREEHRLLSDEVGALSHRFNGVPGSVHHDDLLRFLTDWLNHHILLQDMAYREAIGDPAEAQRVALSLGDVDADIVGIRLGAHEALAHG